MRIAGIKVIYGACPVCLKTGHLSPPTTRNAIFRDGQPWTNPRLSCIHTEENHRWTQMNTDSEGWTQVLLRFALGHGPVKGFSPLKSMASSRSYLCPSVGVLN